MLLRDTWQGWLAIGAAVLFWLMALGDVRGHELTGTEHDEMLLPTVRINSHGGGNGSGIIVGHRDGLKAEEGVRHGYGRHYSVKRTKVVYTYILTNVHVVNMNRGPLGRGMEPKGARFALYGETEFREAELVLKDNDLDLALLRYEGEVGVAAKFAVELPQPFDEVWAVGSPLGVPIHITKGYVSNLCDVAGTDRCHILHSASIAPGNSGGGLWKLNGEGYELIGINSRGYTIGNVPSATMSAAIPVTVVHEFLNRVFPLVVS